MNAKQLQYVIELSKSRSFSQTSEKLNISQPSLSKQILGLEKELNIKLFDRNTVPFTVTPAGEHFIRHAQALLYQEDQLLRSLEQFRSGERGRLVIGVSPFRNLLFMPEIVRKIKARFPGVQVVLQEPASDQLRKEAAEGKYDLAIVNLPVDDSVLDITLLEQEKLVLAVPDSLVGRIHADISDPSGIDFSACAELPFVVLAQQQEMRRYFDSLCAANDVTPDIAVEVAGGLTSAWSMARAGLGATLLPLQFAGDGLFDSGLTLLTLKGTTFTRQTAVVTRRGQYLSPYARYAMELLTGKTGE